MNTLFLVNEAITEHEGISKKILSQVNALRHHGMKVALSYLGVNDKKELTCRYVDEEMIDKYSGTPIICKLKSWCNYKNLYQYIKKKEVKLLYIRYTHFANPFFKPYN